MKMNRQKISLANLWAFGEPGRPPGKNREAYESFKTFLNFEGAESVGNCAACHGLPSLADGKSHLVVKDAVAKQTPSLRNLGQREIDLAKVLQQKVHAALQKQTGKANKISDAYVAIK